MLALEQTVILDGGMSNALEDRGQEGARPVARADLRNAARIGDRDEGGQVVRLGTERITHP